MKNLILKAWAWVLVAFGIVCFVVFVAYEQHRAADKYESDRQSWCATLPAAAPAKEESCADKGPKRDSYLPWWYVLVTWPEGMTTWAIVATGFVIAWQSWETRKAAKAARDSIQVQEAGMRQWIKMEFVRSRYRQPLFDADGEICLQLPVEINFQAINPTPFPLIVKKIVIETSGALGNNSPEWETFTIDESDILKPARDGQEASYPFHITLNLVGERVKQYQRGSLMISISSNVFFESVTGRNEEQSFASVVKCGPVKDEILASSRLASKRDDKQNPN